ncbi:MAG: hypothetical protein ACOYN0_20300, partial [Phycisphaerales bacterium]
MARRRRQIVLMSSATGEGAGLGCMAAVVSKFADFNTGGDGAASRGSGTEFLYGPGFLVELPTGQDDVKQAIITVQDEDI